MVFTRTQKRKIDDLQQTNAIDENLEVQDDFSNVRLTKKKRIPTKKSVKKTQEACIQTDVDTGVDADVEDSTDDSFINDNDDNDNTDTNTDEEDAKQSTDKTTDGSTDKTTDGSTDNCEELDRILYDSDNSQDETEEQSKINYIGSVLVDTIQNVLKQVIKVDNQSDVEPSVKERDEYDKYIKNINNEFSTI